MKTNNQSTTPRPLNCFLLYRLEKQKEIVAKCAGANHRDISKIIAKWWKEASDEEKKYYREKSRIAKMEHSKIYPNYKYAPKKKIAPKRIYIRKNKKEQFTSRIEENNKIMELIYENPSALEGISPEAQSSVSKKSVGCGGATKNTLKSTNVNNPLIDNMQESDYFMTYSNYPNSITTQLSPGLSYTSSVSPQVGSFFDYEVSSPYTVSTQIDAAMTACSFPYNYPDTVPLVNNVSSYDNTIDYFNFNPSVNSNNDNMFKIEQNFGWTKPVEPLFDFSHQQQQQQFNDDFLMMQFDPTLNYIDPTLLHM
ncbi:MAG: hypothetical protein EXX96DRAFT_142369 [Benjaminiella poitrasii]|nr:MAG: hypothetical protein EXX96DRAFT_142369 [Benjaminiella poitrasii]